MEGWGAPLAYKQPEAYSCGVLIGNMAEVEKLKWLAFSHYCYHSVLKLGIGKLRQHNILGSIFKHNTVNVASIIVRLAESTPGTVYLLHWHLSDIHNDFSSKNWYMDTCSGKFSSFRLLYCRITAASSNNMAYNQFTTPGLALGSKVKSHYIIEHNVSIIGL